MRMSVASALVAAAVAVALIEVGGGAGAAGLRGLDRAGTRTAAPLAASAHGKAKAKAGVVARWRMNEKSGASVMKDAAKLGGRNNGTIRKVRTGVPGLVSGKAYRFNGKTSYVRVPDANSLDPGGRPITMTATVKPVNKAMSDDSYDLVRKGYSTTKGGSWKMEIKRDVDKPAFGRLHCVFRTVMPNGKKIPVSRIANVDIIDGKKHTLKCIRTADAVKAVVDGKVFTNKKASGTMANSKPVYVGAKKPGDDVLRGVLDAVAIRIG